MASGPAAPFAGFHQLAYVTTDLERALDRLAAHYAVGDFETFEVALELEDGGHTDIRAALGVVGALQLEVIEPAGGRDAIYRDALAGATGFALVWHHVGFMRNSHEELDRARPADRRRRRRRAQRPQPRHRAVRVRRRSRAARSLPRGLLPGVSAGGARRRRQPVMTASISCRPSRKSSPSRSARHSRAEYQLRSASG